LSAGKYCVLQVNTKDHVKHVVLIYQSRHGAEVRRSSGSTQRKKLFLLSFAVHVLSHHDFGPAMNAYHDKKPQTFVVFEDKLVSEKENFDPSTGLYSPSRQKLAQKGKAARVPLGDITEPAIKHRGGCSGNTSFFPPASDFTVRCHVNCILVF
jgi:hypothetical protein